MLLAVAPPMRSLLAREPPSQRTAGRDADEAAAQQGRWHRARGVVAEQGRRQCTDAAAEPAGRLAGAPWQSKGADNAKAPLRSKGAVNTQAPLRSQLEGWPGRCCGARAPTIRRHRRGARATNKVQAPLQSKGAGRKQELARGVRS